MIHRGGNFEQSIGFNFQGEHRQYCHPERSQMTTNKAHKGNGKIK